MTRPRILLIAVLAVLGLGVAALVGRASPGLAVGDRAPDFELVADDGRPVRLYDVLTTGRRVVLYFYAQNDTPG
jgi:hypothetical protein